VCCILENGFYGILNSILHCNFFNARDESEVLTISGWKVRKEFKRWFANKTARKQNWQKKSYLIFIAVVEIKIFHSQTKQQVGANSYSKKKEQKNPKKSHKQIQTQTTLCLLTFSWELWIGRKASSSENWQLVFEITSDQANP